MRLENRTLTPEICPVLMHAANSCPPDEHVAFYSPSWHDQNGTQFGCIFPPVVVRREGELNFALGKQYPNSTFSEFRLSR